MVLVWSYLTQGNMGHMEWFEGKLVPAGSPSSGSNHSEVAIAVATSLFGLTSGAALATVVGVLTEVPFMLLLVYLCLKTRGFFRR